MRARLHPADATLVAVISCFSVGLFAAWAAHGFSWSSAREHRVAVPVHRKAATPRPRIVAPRRTIPRVHASPHLTLYAARGATWVSVRAGTQSGRTLYEGLLSPRQRISVPGRRFVVRSQGAANLDAVLGTHRVNLSRYELRDVLITPSGIRLLAGKPAAPIVAS
jgi:hypothetical protein